MRVTGRDGKTYPAQPATPQDRRRAIALAHRLRCGRGLSERAVAEQMATTGMRRSVGTVHTYLSTWTCQICRTPAPPPRERAPVPIEVYGESVFGGQGGGYGWH